MKINRSIAAALLLACASRAFSAVGADPNDKLDKLFVGRYGEIVSFDKGMSVLARNRGDMEVVDFYAPERYVNGHFIRFDPEKVKLTPNVFVQEDLIELIAAPAAASRYPHLTDLRASKEAELRGQGAEYTVIEDPYPEGDFPAGSFEIRVEKPYRLTQLYTQTTTHRFILTAKDYPPRFNDSYRAVRISLAQYIARSRRPEVTQPAPPGKTPGQRVLREKRLWLRDWSLLEAAVLLLVVLMQRAPSFPRLRWSLTTLFVSSVLGSALAWILGLVFALSPALSRHWFGPAATASLVLMLPMGSLARRASGRKPSRTGGALLVLYALILAACGWLLQETTPNAWLPLIPLYSMIFGGSASALSGLIWGASSVDARSA